MGKHATKEDMYGLIMEWKQSEDSKRIFCDRHGIKMPTFQYWERKYGNEERQAGGDKFMSLTVTGLNSDVTEGEVEIHYPNGMRITVSKEMSEPFLESVVGLLGRCLH